MVRPLEPAHLDHEAAEQADVGDRQDRPGDGGHGLAGAAELDALRQERRHQDRHERPERPGHHVDRRRRVVARRDRPGGVEPRAGGRRGGPSWPGPARSSRPGPCSPTVGRPSRREQADQLHRAEHHHDQGGHEPEREPGRQPLVEDEDREQHGDQRQAGRQAGGEHGSWGPRRLEGKRGACFGLPDVRADPAEFSGRAWSMVDGQTIKFPGWSSIVPDESRSPSCPISRIGHRSSSIRPSRKQFRFAGG